MGALNLAQKRIGFTFARSQPQTRSRPADPARSASRDRLRRQSRGFGAGRLRTKPGADRASACVVVDSRGNHITIAGSRDGCDAVRRVWRRCMRRRRRARSGAGDVEGAIRAVIAQGSLFEFDAKTVNLVRDHQPAQATGAGSHAAQDSYIRALKRMNWCSASAPRHRQDWLAWPCRQLFERKEVDRIICSRPAVEPASAGFLPGDLREKVDPICGRLRCAVRPDGFADRRARAAGRRSRSRARLHARDPNQCSDHLDEAQK